MKIGLFTDSYPPHANGVAISVMVLRNALIKAGHDVYVVTVNNDKLNYKYDETERILRLPSIPIGLYDYRISGIYNIKAMKQIKKWNLDIIHTHMEFGIGIFGRIAAKQLGIPLVHTYHTLYEDYTHYITKGYFDGTAKKIVEHFTKFYCDTNTRELIVPSAKTYKLFTEKYKFEKSIHIIPTGLEIEKFYQEQHKKNKVLELKQHLGIEATDFVILSVGRVAQEKNTEKLVEWHKDIIKKHKNIKLVIVGPGPDLEKLKKLAIKQKIEDKVIFTGKVDYSQIPLYYQIGDVFTTASLSETQGVIVIEAVAASLPVVAANDESFKMVITENFNGYLFDNKKEYLKSINKLIEDPKERKKLARNARNSALTHSSENFATNIEKVYKKAIEETGGAGKKTFWQKIMIDIKKGVYGE